MCLLLFQVQQSRRQGKIRGRHGRNHGQSPRASHGRQEDAKLRRDTSDPVGRKRTKDKVPKQQRARGRHGSRIQGTPVHEHLDPQREGDIQRKIPAASEELWGCVVVFGQEIGGRLRSILLFE